MTAQEIAIFEAMITQLKSRGHTLADVFSFFIQNLPEEALADWIQAELPHRAPGVGQFMAQYPAGFGRHMGDLLYLHETRGL